MKDEVVVGIARIGFSREGEPLATIGLGSCIGVVISDRASKISALGHFMLPDSSKASDTKLKRPAKYGDTCIREMVRTLEEEGCSKTNMIAKAAGGASMFRRLDNHSILDIARKNIFSLRQNLAREQVPLISDDLGGNKGRTITYHPADNRLSIKIVQANSRKNYSIINI